MRWVLEKAAPEKADWVASKYFNFRKLRGCGALSRESMIINRRLSVTKEDIDVRGQRSEVRDQEARSTEQGVKGKDGADDRTTDNGTVLALNPF